MRDFLLVGTGGFIGSVLRYWLSTVVQQTASTPFPAGTLFVNLTGAFILGMLVEFLAGAGEWAPSVRLFVGVGVLGGYTTFSTFALETLRLGYDDRWLLFAANAAGSVVLGLLSAWLGVVMVRLAVG